MEEKNINLMPKESRGDQKDIAPQTKVDDFQPQLVIPQKEEAPLKDKINFQKEESFFSKFFKKKEKEEKPLVQDIKKEEKPQVQEIKKEEKPQVQEIKKESKPPKSFALPEKESIKFHEPQPVLRARLIGQDAQGVDLIPAAAKIRNWQQINRLFFLAFLASLGVLLVFYIGLFIFERSLDIKEKTTTKEISEIENDLLGFVDLNEEIKELGQQIILVYNALNKHIYWTNFFTLLEQYTLANVHYNGFSAGSGGSLILNAVGDDFNAVAKQLKILEQSENFVTEVSISSAALSEEGVEFSIVLNLDPHLFYYQEN